MLTYILGGAVHAHLPTTPGPAIVSLPALCATLCGVQVHRHPHVSA